MHLIARFLMAWRTFLICWGCCFSLANSFSMRSRSISSVAGGLEYTCFFMRPHKKMSQGVRSGLLGSHWKRDKQTSVWINVYWFVDKYVFNPFHSAYCEEFNFWWKLMKFCEKKENKIYNNMQQTDLKYMHILRWYELKKKGTFFWNTLYILWSTSGNRYILRYLQNWLCFQKRFSGFLNFHYHTSILYYNDHSVFICLYTVSPKKLNSQFEC